MEILHINKNFWFIKTQGKVVHMMKWRLTVISVLFYWTRLLPRDWKKNVLFTLFCNLGSCLEETGIPVTLQIQKPEERYRFCFCCFFHGQTSERHCLSQGKRGNMCSAQSLVSKLSQMWDIGLLLMELMPAAVNCLS